MKTYLINTLQKISTTNRSLDFTSTIKSSEWIIFNEDKSIIEKFLFIDNENLLISINGNTSYAKWKYININTSLVIDDNQNKYLFKIIECNNNIIVLNIDGTNTYSFLINTKFAPKIETYETLQWYLIHKCGLDILNEKQKEIYIKKKEEELYQKEKAKRLKLKNILIISGIILTIIVVSCSIKIYIEYKKEHPTLYTTKKQNQKAIDLGLSVKWATCNIGANSPEENGNYYGWGEPTGTDVYKYNEPVYILNKRFPIRHNEIPPYSIINTSKDIAKYNWGGNWRMPTKKEAQELIDKCKIQYYKSKGKHLVKITGPNGNFIIIPSASYLNGTEGERSLKYYKYYICLWTGELSSSYINDFEYPAAFLFIGDTYDKGDLVKEEKIYSKERYKMLPVRAVLDK
ncbi:MAG: hypothetical protein UH103_05095 [Paludibacteraceae bacterium]|nr:hypothetical protein [Paludibacteraceae bacterium]